MGTCGFDLWPENGAAVKRLMQIIRTLHLYLSMLGLVLIAFFALSGFMLNHEDWFKPDDVRAGDANFTTLPRAMIPPEAPQEGALAPEAQRKLEARLRSEFHIRGEMKDPIVKEDRVEIEFDSPGRTTTATILLTDDEDNPNGDRQVIVRSQSTGLVGRLCDLHRMITKRNGDNGGYFVGRKWKYIVDGAAIVLLITALTGLILWIGTFKRRWLAILPLAAGAALFVLAYLVLVP